MFCILNFNRLLSLTFKLSIFLKTKKNLRKKLSLPQLRKFMRTKKNLRKSWVVLNWEKIWELGELRKTQVFLRKTQVFLRTEKLEPENWEKTWVFMPGFTPSRLGCPIGVTVINSSVRLRTSILLTLHPARPTMQCSRRWSQSLKKHAKMGRSNLGEVGAVFERSVTWWHFSLSDVTIRSFHVTIPRSGIFLAFLQAAEFFWRFYRQRQASTPCEGRLTRVALHW